MLHPQCNPYMQHFYLSFDTAPGCYIVCFIKLLWQLLLSYKVSVIEEWMTLTEHQNNQTKTNFTATLNATCHTWTDLRLNPGLPSERPGTNSSAITWSCCTVHALDLCSAGPQFNSILCKQLYWFNLPVLSSRWLAVGLQWPCKVLVMVICVIIFFIKCNKNTVWSS
jgi:hypothetical protein